MEFNLLEPLVVILKDFYLILISVSFLVVYTSIELISPSYSNKFKSLNLKVSLFYSLSCFMVINLILYIFFYSGDKSQFFLFNYSLTNIYCPNFFLDLLICMFIFIFIAAGSDICFQDLKHSPFEVNFFLIFLLIGMVFVIYSFDFLTFFLNLELQNFSLYILVNGLRNKKTGLEISINYFIIGCVSSGVLLYGISLIYAVDGKSNFFEFILNFYSIDNLNFLLITELYYFFFLYL